MPDAYENQSASLCSPLVGALDVTPSDSVNLAQTTRQIRITGQGGTIAVVWASGTESIEPVTAGEVRDWRILRVKATGTTATGIRGYY